MNKKTVIVIVVVLLLAALFFSALSTNPPLMPGEVEQHGVWSPVLPEASVKVSQKI